MFDYVNFETHPEDVDADDVSIHVFGVTHKTKAREPEDWRERMRLFLHSKPVHVRNILNILFTALPVCNRAMYNTYITA